MFDCVSGKHPVLCRPDRWAKKATHSKTKISGFLMCVCDIFYAFFYVTVYSKMSEFGDMLKDLSEEKLNLCKDIRRVVKTFLRHSFDIREKTWGGHKKTPTARKSYSSCVLKDQILSLLHSVSQYNRVLELARPLWRAGDKTIFLFSQTKGSE
jgi:hypothetical protein